MTKIWKYKDVTVTIQTKRRLVNALVFPVAMYGCESWTGKKKEKRKRRKLTVFKTSVGDECLIFHGL